MLILVAWVDASHHGLATSGVGVAWESTNLISSLIYTAIFERAAQWRNPFYVAAAVNAVCGIAVVLLLQNSPAQQGYRMAYNSSSSSSTAKEEKPPPPPAPRRFFGLLPPSPPPSEPSSQKSEPLVSSTTPTTSSHPLDTVNAYTAMATFASDPSFLLVLGANALGIAQSYIVQQMPAWSYQALNASAQSSTLTLTVFSSGCLIGLLFGGRLHDLLDAKGRLIAVTAYILILMIASIILPITYASGATSMPLLYVILALAGFSGAVPQYVVTTVYFVQVGGPVHAGTSSTFADLFGIIFSTITQLVVGQLLDHNHYLSVLILYAIMSAFMSCFLLAFVVREAGKAEAAASSK